MIFHKKNRFINIKINTYLVESEHEAPHLSVELDGNIGHEVDSTGDHHFRLPGLYHVES